MTLDNKKLQDWLGRSETNYDTITISPYLLFNAALNSDEQQPRAGEPLRPGSHWLYFLPTTRQSELGPNGNSKVGGFLPPVELPRRMWAGGKLNFHRPLKFGERSKKVKIMKS